MPLTPAEAKELKTALDIFTMNKEIFDKAGEQLDKARDLLRDTVIRLKDKEPIGGMVNETENFMRG